jgi:hypothetical protein
MSNVKNSLIKQWRWLWIAVIVTLLFAGLSTGVQPVRAAPTELFFSEYIEGSSNNKALEIYNGTGATVDLTAGGYNVQMYFNGSVTPTLTISLTGTIANGDVFVLAHSGANATILAQADQTNGAGWYNGDDVVVLRKSTTVIDVIGQVGFDPGTEWGSDVTSTADNTLRRKANIQAGDTNPNDVFDPAVQWDGYATDTFDGLGSHTLSVSDVAPSVVSSTPANGATNVALNADVTVTFSEPVNVTGAWFTISCGTSGAHTASVTGGPTTFTLNPATDFVAGETCTFTVVAAQVSDQDANDPPDTMTANFVATFTTAGVCALPFTPIPQIQGAGATAAITGTVTTQGVVIGDYEGASPTLRGFYMQDLTGDGNPATSDGIFIFNGNNNNVALGQVVRVTGTAAEFQDQTQITATSITQCGTGSVNPVDVTLPFSSASFPERYEGMLVRLPQTLYVTEHFQLGRFGQVVMSSGARLKQPTNVVAPGAPALALQAQNNLNRIIIDDEQNNQNPDPIRFGRGGNPLSASNTLRGGDTATGIIGVMTYTWAGNAASGNAYRVRPINALGGSVPNFQPANPRPASMPSPGGTLRVAAMNLLNYFNTFDGLPDTVDNCALGVGGAATDCRGADTQAEFDRQSPKTVAAIIATGADIIGINEIENDGYGATSAIQDLVNRLNAATAPGTFAFIDADARTGQVNALGTDAIKVGMIYKPGKVTPLGTAVLNSVAFVNGGDSAPRNRPSLAQAFQQNSNGAKFVVDVNHLKSKGSACDAPDAGDGQGNCNIVRRNAANELVAWLATDPTGVGDPDVLIIGDLNSYAMEDPVNVIKNAGFTNLVAKYLNSDAYSYVFDGQWGYLDHALGSASLTNSQVAGVVEWHINADEPSVLDYNTDFKSAGQIASLYAPDQYRVSDHDPIVVGLTLNGPPTVNAGGPYNVNEGASVTVTASGSDPDGNALTYGWDLNNDGTFETSGKSATFSAAGLDGPGSRTIKVKVTDPGGLSATAQATVNILNVAPNVGAITVAPIPVMVHTAVNASAKFNDPGVLDTHTATWDWGDGTTSAGTIVETNGAGTVSGSHAYKAAGFYAVKVTVTDKDGGIGQSPIFKNVIVFDPNAGFVTGGGFFDSPAGAFPANPKLTGKSNFGFIARYPKGIQTPHGMFLFQFKEGNLTFHSIVYDWLVVSGNKAVLKGSGKVNNAGDYGFIASVVTGAKNWQMGDDKLRIKIWNKANGTVIYDTQPGAPDEADATLGISGGNITIIAH